LSDRYQDFTRRSAAAAGAQVERAAAVALDRLEDACLWVQERGLAATPGSTAFRDAGQTLFRMRRQLSPMPHRLGRLAAGSTYFGLRIGTKAYGMVRELVDESVEFAKTDDPLG
jgi:hypothetical protein